MQIFVDAPACLTSSKWSGTLGRDDRHNGIQRWGGQKLDLCLVWAHTNAWLNFAVSPFIVHGVNSFVYLTETIRIGALLTTNVESLSSTGDRFNHIGQAAQRYCKVFHNISTLTTLLPSSLLPEDGRRSDGFKPSIYFYHHGHGTT